MSKLIVSYIFYLRCLGSQFDQHWTGFERARADSAVWAFGNEGMLCPWDRECYGSYPAIRKWLLWLPGRVHFSHVCWALRLWGKKKKRKERSGTEETCWRGWDGDGFLNVKVPIFPCLDTFVSTPFFIPCSCFNLSAFCLFLYFCFAIVAEYVNGSCLHF